MWNASSLLDLVAALATRMQPEPPGTAGYGFEFWLERSDCREWNQVKYQRGVDGRWSLASLKSEKVLERFREKLESDPRVVCQFISSHAASPLDLLCARAHHARTFDEFGGLMENATLRKEFRNLWRDHWKTTDTEAWRWLADRVRVRALDWPGLDERLQLRITALIDGDLDRARQVLHDFLFSNT